jgi:hypothetical protein
MADVVEQGPEPGGPGRLPAGLRRAGIAVAAVLAVLGLSRSGLLSADEPQPQPEPSPSDSATPGEDRALLVARVGDRLLLAAPGAAEPGARLPTDLPADARLVPVRLPGEDDPPVASDGPGPVLGVADGVLVRVDPARPRWRSLGPADAVVSASYSPAKAIVLRGSELEEVEIATGGQTDARPFPGFDPETWTAQGVLAAAGSGALVMTRSAGQGRSVLALAWPNGVVRTGTQPLVEELGTIGPLLGIADDWVITLSPGCPGTACRIRVVSVTRDLVQARDKAPPDGWTFIDGPSAGRTHEALVPIEHLTGGRPDGRRALARLVPGGDNALLVDLSDNVALDAGLADGPGGTVYLLSATPGVPGGQLQARIWDPQNPASTRLLLPRTTFPDGARLVCVCG